MENSNSLLSFLPLLVLILVFYFLVFRPQQKQKKKHADMVASLKRGDKIVTNGGFVCEVIRQDERFISVWLGDNQVRLSKEYVGYKIDDFGDSGDGYSNEDSKHSGGTQNAKERGLVEPKKGKKAGGEAKDSTESSEASKEKNPQNSQDSKNDTESKNIESKN